MKSSILKLLFFIVLINFPGFAQKPSELIIEVSKDGSEPIVSLENYFDYLKKDYCRYITFSIINIENEGNYLFIKYWSGGAHCCSVLEAFKFDPITKHYSYSDEFWVDGDFSENINYPFEVSTDAEYFYSCYACKLFVECDSKFQEYFIIENNAFKKIATADEDRLVQCFKKYFNDLIIPKLNELGFDNGERELILNELENIYLLKKDVEYIFELYNNHILYFDGKTNLWFKIIERILPKPEYDEYLKLDQKKHYNLLIERS